MRASWENWQYALSMQVSFKDPHCTISSSNNMNILFCWVWKFEFWWLKISCLEIEAVFKFDSLKTPKIQIFKFRKIKVHLSKEMTNAAVLSEKKPPLKSVHFKKTVARILILSKLWYILFVLICIESTTILKESRLAQLFS